MDQQKPTDRDNDILAFWEREKIFEKTVERDAPNGEFTFYEGPPTANALPGMHHVEARTYKDIIPRYKTMRGYRVRRKAGWDTHGLPVELQLEKKLGMKTKHDIEQYGIAKFNAACRDSVWEFKEKWEDITRKIGYWVDLGNPYVTYEMPYVESIWWFLKQASEKGLLARDYRIVHWCPRCETPLSSHEVAQGYEDDVEDPSVYVKFVLTPESVKKIDVPEGTAFLVWTTTPWTLPGNGALAVHPDVEYAVVRVPVTKTEGAPESPSAGSETHGTGTQAGLSPIDEYSIGHNVVKFGNTQASDGWTGGESNPQRQGDKPTSSTSSRPNSTGQFQSYLILAKPLVARVLGEGATIERVITKKDLRGLYYEPLYPRIDTTAHPNAYQVLDADFVSMEDGTGIVHVAPAYGVDDFQFKERGIPPTFSVNEKGIMADGLPGAGKFAKQADDDVRADLQARGLLFRDEKIRHTYPFCWRCKTPLLYYARASWYIMMSKLREELQKRNQTINWIPAHLREGRFGEWLKEVKDWAITRERYWGTPLPIWECDRCHAREVIGSFAELKARIPRINQYLLMRHGEAESNARGIISASIATSDRYPLTAEGRARVTESAERLKGTGITKIIASPYARMRETAEIISKAIGIPVTYDDRLREINLPDFDGKSPETHSASFANKLERFTKKIGANETWGELASRMMLALRDIDAQNKGENILICSHGDPLFLLKWAWSGRTKQGISGMPYPQFDDPHPFDFIGALVNDRGELDVHRPVVDGFKWTCAKEGCGGAMQRFPEVVDVWLDSGCMPFAQSHFPFEENGISNFKSQISNPPAAYPAAYISEGIDQTRGWFYTLLAVATVLGWDAPYQNAISLGHLLDTNGQKMSKSKGNIVNPWDILERYGADVIRWYMVAVNQPSDPKAFNEADLKQMSRKPFGTLANVLSFWELHGGNVAAQWSNISPPSPHGGEGGRGGERRDSGILLDSWLRARVAATHAEVTRRLDAYEITESARAISDLVDDASTWWLRRSRERLKEADASARGTFTATLRSIAILIAPFAPFTAEQLWMSLRGARGDGEVTHSVIPSRAGGEGPPVSVHLASWDFGIPPATDRDAAILAEMEDVRRCCSLGLEARTSAGIPVRQVLAQITVKDGSRISDALRAIICDELNVKAVAYDPALPIAVDLDTTITPELKREGMIRELTRATNNIRKEMGFTPSDRIRVAYSTDDVELKQAIAEHGEVLARGTQGEWDMGAREEAQTLTIGETTIRIRIERV